MLRWFTLIYADFSFYIFTLIFFFKRWQTLINADVTLIYANFSFCISTLIIFLILMNADATLICTDYLRLLL